MLFDLPQSAPLPFVPPTWTWPLAHTPCLFLWSFASPAILETSLMMERETRWEGRSWLLSLQVEHSDSEFWGKQSEQNRAKHPAGKRPSQSPPGPPHLTDGNTEAQGGGVRAGI